MAHKSQLIHLSGGLKPYLRDKNPFIQDDIEGRILLRESSQGESSRLRVRLEGSLKTHYDVYSLLANVYSLLANVYSLPANVYSLR